MPMASKKAAAIQRPVLSQAMNANRTIGGSSSIIIAYV
jgi:hypothetical protein